MTIIIIIIVIITVHNILCTADEERARRPITDNAVAIRVDRALVQYIFVISLILRKKK